MIVLHYIDKFDANTESESKFISVLCKGMPNNVESHVVTRDDNILRALYDIMPDIVHVHGCWSYRTASFLLSAHRRGFYTVFSPCGGLQPWIIKKNFWKSFLPRIIAYQYITVHRADTILVSSKIEKDNILRLHWNKRIRFIKNVLQTQDITIEEMCNSLLLMYQDIIDEHIEKEINIITQQSFYTLVKAGLSYDVNQLRPNLSVISEKEKKNFTLLKYNDWRFLSIFAERNEMNDIISRGLSVIGMENKMNIPTGITIIPSPKNTDDIVNAVHLMKNKIWRRKLTIKDICGLYTILRYNDYDEDELKTKLKKKRLAKLLGRLEYILIEITGIEEGFLPIMPINDYITRHIKNNMKI